MNKLKTQSGGSIELVCSAITCQWEMRFGKKCGAPARYLLGDPDEDKVPICSLHQSQASTLGWPTCTMRQNKI